MLCFFDAGCDSGEDDCDKNSECRSGLKCGTDNCNGSGYGGEDDCCF